MSNSLVMPKQIICATSNQHKLLELQQWSNPLGIQLLALPADEKQLVEETGVTFAENAALKAAFWRTKFHRAIIADDSGIVVPALGGEPGVYSARYLANYQQQLAQSDNVPQFSSDVALLLHRMKGMVGEERQAYMVCTLAYACPQLDMRCFTGICMGQIASAMQGSGGFGYDCVFIPQGQTQTFAQLPSSFKQRCSHRSMAMHAWSRWLQIYFVSA